MKLDDSQAIEQPETDGRHDKHVDGGDVRRVIAEEGLPALRWRATSPNHVLGHSRLGDLDAELEQLAVEARCTPQRVLSTDTPNKTSDVGRHRGSARPLT